MPVVPGPPIPAYLRTKLVPHAAKVCQLYKAALYEVKSKYPDPLDNRYYAVLMRARFDKHKNEIDMRVAKRLLEEGWAELQQKRAPFPFRWATAPGGVGYQRWQWMPDGVLDMWHPLEKAQYPDYFAKREQRKKEFVERWHKKYGDDVVEDAQFHGDINDPWSDKSTKITGGKH